MNQETTSMWDVFMDGGEISMPSQTHDPNQPCLGNREVGETVKIGGMEFIVLEKTDDGVVGVVTKSFVCKMRYDESSGDYEGSRIRRFLNDDFYRTLVESVGEENIVPHEVHLMAEDGTGKEHTVLDNVSLITAEQYRRHREHLPPCGQWWWTATRWSYEAEGYSRRVCCVDSNGVLGWSDCDDGSGGVRPFCYLNSSVLVDDKGHYGD